MKVTAHIKIILLVLAFAMSLWLLSCSAEQSELPVGDMTVDITMASDFNELNTELTPAPSTNTPVPATETRLPSSPQPEVTSTKRETVTVTTEASLLVTPTPFITPTPTPTPWILPKLKLILLNRCQEIDLSNEQTYFECSIEVQNFSGEVVFRLADEGASYESPRFSADGNWLAYVKHVPSQGKRIHVIRTDWRENEAITDWISPEKIVSIVSWSPDNHWITFSELWRSGTNLFGATYVVNRQGRDSYKIGDNIGFFEWSPQNIGDFVFTKPDTLEKWGIYTASVEDIENVRWLDDSEYSISAASWHPDGSKLALCIEQGQPSLWLWEIASQTWQEIDSFRGVCVPSWSLDGRWLAVITANTIFFYEMQGDLLVAQTEIDTDYDYNVPVQFQFVSDHQWFDAVFVYEHHATLIDLSTQFELVVVHPLEGARMLLWSIGERLEEDVPFTYLRGIGWQLSEDN